MNIASPAHASSWKRLATHAILFLMVAALLLVAFGCYTGEPVFFLKWFFGLQADD